MKLRCSGLLFALILESYSRKNHHNAQVYALHSSRNFALSPQASASSNNKTPHHIAGASSRQFCTDICTEMQVCRLGLPPLAAATSHVQRRQTGNVKRVGYHNVENS